MKKAILAWALVMSMGVTQVSWASSAPKLSLDIYHGVPPLTDFLPGLLRVLRVFVLIPKSIIRYCPSEFINILSGFMS